MTELLIDGKRLTLPSDFSLTVVEENPFFTKNGKYTFDIELSLLDPVNAIAYKHINRENNSAPIFTNRSAVLISDNKILYNGTEIILSITDKSVKIQSVSGNSELNFLIGGDLKIRNLDLGAAVIAPTLIVPNLDKPYPESDWLLIPFANKDNNLIGNDYYNTNSNWYIQNNQTTLVVGPLAYAYDGVHAFKSAAGKTVKYSNYRPQPYLNFIVKKILSALGYEIGTNMIASHDVFKSFYIVHGYDTLNFAQMLPDWTVKTFFEEVEKLFDCTLIINEDKTVDILFNYHFLTINTQKKLQVFDEFTTEIDSKNRLSHQNVNIGYSLDADDYYKFNKLEASIKEAAIIIELNDVQPELDLVSRVTNAADAYRFNKIFEAADGSHYIALNDGTSAIPRKIDSFCNLMLNPENSENIDIDLKIVPAAMKTGTKSVKVFDSQNYMMTYKVYWQYPIAEYTDPFFYEDESSENDFTIQGLITGEDSLPEKTMTSKLRVAMFNGRKTINPHSFLNASGIEIGNVTISPLNYGKSDILFPVAFVEDLAEYFRNSNTINHFNGGVNPFRLSWLWDNIYSLTKKIDTTRTFRRSFIDFGQYDVKSRFIINNREFLCSKIERSVSNDGLGRIATGYFYPID